MGSNEAIANASGEASDSAGADASTGSDGALSCGAPENDAGTCNAVPLAGGFVTAACSDAEPPQPEGGVVDDGSYILDSLTYYGHCPADISSETWSVCGSRWDVVRQMRLPEPDSSLLSELRFNLVAAFAGTTVNFDVACVPTGTLPFTLAPRGYTATPGHITFIEPATQAVLVATFTRP